MADYAVMPYSDYQDACEAVREKTGGTDVIKSGDMGALIRAISGGGDVGEWTAVAVGDTFVFSEDVPGLVYYYADDDSCGINGICFLYSNGEIWAGDMGDVSDAISGTVQDENVVTVRFGRACYILPIYKLPY